MQWRQTAFDTARDDLTENHEYQQSLNGKCFVRSYAKSGDHIPCPDVHRLSGRASRLRQSFVRHGIPACQYLGEQL